MTFENMNCVTWFNEHWYEFNFDLLSPEDKKKFKLEDKKGIDYLKSVTTILGSAPKEWLSQWRGQVGNWEARRVIEEAQTKGTHVHNAVNVSYLGGIVFYNDSKKPKYKKEEIEKLAEGKPYCILEQQQEALEFYRFTRLINLLKPKFVANEFNLYSLRYLYAGTGDHLWEMEEGEYKNGRNIIKLSKGIWLFDTKTGRDDDKNHPKQLAAYANALKETNNIDVEGAGIIYTNADTKTGIEGLKVVIYTKEELKYHFSQFLHVLAIDQEYSSDKPKVIDLPTIYKGLL
jgi:hypothetical protein